MKSFRRAVDLATHFAMSVLTIVVIVPLVLLLLPVAWFMVRMERRPRGRGLW